MPADSPTDPQDTLLYSAKVEADVADLATLASLARRIEPELLRALRRRLADRVAASLSSRTESKLWFHPMVETRGPEAITLLPEYTRALNNRLALDPQLLEDAYAITSEIHATSSPILQWEERLLYLLVRGHASGDDEKHRHAQLDTYHDRSSG